MQPWVMIGFGLLAAATTGLVIIRIVAARRENTADDK